MKRLPELFEKNKAWAKKMEAREPGFFESLSAVQTPEYLWIGCADSRVPANQIVDLKPGDVFVHRNVANAVVHSDLNCLSVIQYSVDVLKIKHIIVCGHYGCGGVTAAMQGSRNGLVDNWLGHIRDVYTKYKSRLSALPEEERLSRLCELNVIEQVSNVCNTTILRDAWERGEDLTVHGWIYALGDGILRDLDLTVTRSDNVADLCSQAADKRLAMA